MSEAPGEHWTWSRSDVQLLRRATEDPRWRIPDRLREEAIYRLGMMLADPATKPKTVIAIARILDAAQRTDLGAERLEIERTKLDPPMSAAEARDAWDHVSAMLDAEVGPGTPEGPPGGLPAPDPGT